MKFWRLLLLLLFTLFSLSSFSQEEEPFKPLGKVIARSFFDFSQGFGHVNNQSGFDLSRALLGYSYQFTPTLKAQVVLDGAATNSSGKKTVYVRNAFINWCDKGFDISVGEIGLIQYSIPQSYWGHRYVLKSFQGLNDMGPSVDLGVIAEYKFNKYISADISISNGEGYKNIEKNKSTRYAAGLNLHPIKNTIFRIYTDIYTDGGDLRDELPEGIADVKYNNQQTLSLFAGYQNHKISGGIEYNRVFNKSFIVDKDYYGYSAYASLKVAPKWSIYGRYDNLNSKTPSAFKSAWNNLDGQLMIAGVEFQPVKQLKVSPNIRNINPDRGKSEQYFFINIEFDL